ncbi:MAG TPA: ATP-binding protein [Pyrinomonadaceae bacterium]|nr:ATP-binding protein [Pyrinomonadaceae bacterium]
MKSKEQVSGRAGAAGVDAAGPRRVPTLAPSPAPPEPSPTPPDSPHAPADSSPPARVEASVHETTRPDSPHVTPRHWDDARHPPRPEPMAHERRVLLMALAAGAPGVVVSLVLLWVGGYTPKVVWTLGALVVCFWLGFSFAVQGRVVRPLQTVSNLLAALREGDYSFRARGGRGQDALSEVIREINALGETMREQRIGALEATALLRTVMAEIDVAVFAFDPERRLRLVNRAGERLLSRPEERAYGRTAEELGLADVLRVRENDETRTLTKAFPGDGGQLRRWGVRRSTFRERGVPHQLLVIGDLSRPLREEELKAWQRIVRVLGHELNNSLAPIKSIAGSVSSLLARDPLPADWREDVRSGLDVVSARAESLSRFMESYARLARLPPPKMALVGLGQLVRRVAGLETRVRVSVVPGPELTVRADADQLEQLLINLVRNAADASLVTGGGVRLGWRAASNGNVEICVEDEGLGLANTSNLFVPFFTTKPGGSGIGLVLSRQIAEAHGGALTLENRHGSPGCAARLRLPA